MAQELTPQDIKVVEQVARYYRRLVTHYAACIILGIPCAVFGAVRSLYQDRLHDDDPIMIAAIIVVSILQLAAIGCLFSAVYGMYRMMRFMGDRAAWAWTLGLLVGCCGISLIVLIVAVIVANKWFADRGVPVGPLGPSRQTIQDLQARRGDVARFVRERRHTGQTDEEIIETLVRNGWSLPDARQAVQETQTD